MDHGQGEECYFLVCWFACRDCLRDTVLDGYAIFLFVCLVDGWMDGWMDGRTDGCCVSQGGRGCGGGRSATGWAVLVAWFVGCLVGLLAWPRCCLVGWSAGWHSVDGCMDGRMDGSCAASRSGGVRVSFRRFPSFRTVSTQFPEGSEGLVTRSYWGENKGFARAGTSGVKQTGGDIVLCAGSMGYLLHRRRVEKKGSRVKKTR